jgi:hypothetical protein
MREVAGETITWGQLADGAARLAGRIGRNTEDGTTRPKSGSRFAGEVAGSPSR